MSLPNPKHEAFAQNPLPTGSITFIRDGFSITFKPPYGVTMDELSKMSASARTIQFPPRRTANHGHQIALRVSVPLMRGSGSNAVS